MDPTEPCAAGSDDSCAFDVNLRQILANDRSERDNGGNTPLHWAAAHHALAGAKVLFDNSADVNAKNVNGDMPLHIAAREDLHEVVVSLVIKWKAEVNVKNLMGNTPMALAHFGIRGAGSSYGGLVTSGNTAHGSIYALLREYGGVEESDYKAAKARVDDLMSGSTRTNSEALDIGDSNQQGSSNAKLVCSGCGKTYAIAENAVAVTLEYELTLASCGVIVSYGLPQKQGGLGSRFGHCIRSS